MCGDGWDSERITVGNIVRRTESLRKSLQNLQMPTLEVATDTQPRNLAEAVDCLQKKLADHTQQDWYAFHTAPVTELMPQLTGCTLQAAKAAEILQSQANGISASEIQGDQQQAVDLIIALPHEVKKLLRQAQSMHPDKQLDARVVSIGDSTAIMQTGTIWTEDMAGVFRVAHDLFQDFPDSLSSLMQCMTKLAAIGMCLAATRDNPTAAGAVLTGFSHQIDQLHASMLIRTDSVWQTHAQVQLLQGFAAKVLAQKQERSRLLADAHGLLAVPIATDASSADSISAALASVSSQQHGIVVIANANGVARLSSANTTVSFGTVLSNTGSMLRTIRMVNNSNQVAHVKVSSYARILG